MEELIQAINKLQDVFNTLNLNNPIELPVICMIGSQVKFLKSLKFPSLTFLIEHSLLENRQF